MGTLQLGLGRRINRIKDYMAGKITDSTIPVPNNPSLWADGYSQGNDNIDYYDYFFKDNVFAHEHNISVLAGQTKYNTIYQRTI